MPHEEFKENEQEADLDKETLDAMTKTFSSSYDSDREFRAYLYSFTARGHKIAGYIRPSQYLGGDKTSGYDIGTMSFSVDRVDVEKPEEIAALRKKYGNTVATLIETKNKEKEAETKPIEDMLK